MTQSKRTKRALIASVLALVVCAAMLIGTTFAWFTDSVTSGRNTITAGNLDVELEYATATEGTLGGWTSVNDATDLFGDGLWEPGYAQVVYLRVRNAGTLALRYQLSMNILSETAGVNVNGQTFNLSDELQYGAVLNQSVPFANRDVAIDAVTSPVALSTAYTSGEMHLEANAEPQYLALVVYMPKTVGNEANYRGDVVPTIELGVNLLATQDTVEEDSFDNLYDQDAWEEVSDAAGLQAAISEGKTASLTQDIVLDSTLPMSPSGETNIVLNGNELKTTSENTTMVENGETLTVSGGSLSIGEGMFADMAKSALQVTDGSTIRLLNVDYRAGGTGVFAQGQNATVEIINSVIEAPSFCVGTNAGNTANHGVDIRIINSRLETTHFDGWTGSAVLMNVPGNLTIEGSTIIGECNAVIVRSGTATIRNSVLSRPYAVEGANESEIHMDGNWGSGNNVPLATLLLGNRAENAYQYPTVCRVENTTITSAAAGAKTVYLYGNQTAELGVTFTYDDATVIQPADESVEPIVYGGGYVTVNGELQP